VRCHWAMITHVDYDTKSNAELRHVTMTQSQASNLS
jgi:hypothetical protein